jgi:hypothetical protein
MDKILKITYGFVVQTFEKDPEGNYVFTGQNFVAGDQVEYEDEKANPVSGRDLSYEPFTMDEDNS